jgi:hypothetical protein
MPEAQLSLLVWRQVRFCAVYAIREAGHADGRVEDVDLAFGEIQELAAGNLQDPRVGMAIAIRQEGDEVAVGRYDRVLFGPIEIREPGIGGSVQRIAPIGLPASQGPAADGNACRESKCERCDPPWRRHSGRWRLGPHYSARSPAQVHDHLWQNGRKSISLGRARFEGNGPLDALEQAIVDGRYFS